MLKLSYRNKLKIKFIFYHLLGVATNILILFIARACDRFLEIIVVMICFFIFRKLYDKQYHAKSLITCAFISLIVFVIISHIVVSKSISILFSVILAFIINLISYFIKDYLDNKLLVKYYTDKINNLKIKCIENLTEDELYNLMPKIRKDIVRIVYNYLHKPSNMNGQIFALKNNIGEATLYRYLKLVKRTYEEMTITK